MALLIDEIVKVPGLTGSNSERLNAFGQKFFGSNYSGSYDQNIQLYNNIQSGNFGAAPASAAPVQPTQPTQVTPFLKEVQQQELIQQNQITPVTQDQGVIDAKASLDTATANLNNTTTLPTAPNLEETFGKLRDQYGVSTLEEDLNGLKASEQETYARLRARTNNEKGERVGMGVIAGRVSEIQQQEQDQLDFVQRQITTKTNQVQAAYGVIDTLMNLKTNDFNNAMKLYDAEFNKNVKMYEIANDNYKDTRDFTQRLKERAEDNAKANLQIYSDLITSGSLIWNNMDNQTKTAISRLEVQSGLGMGFLSSLDLPANARIQQIGTRVDASGNKYADTMIRNKDGSYEVKSTYLGVDGEFVAAQNARQAQLNLSYAQLNNKGSGGGTTDKSAVAKNNFNTDTQLNASGQSPTLNNNTGIGYFPQLVAKYADSLSLNEIYSLYNNSTMGKTWGAPTEDLSKIRQIYDNYK